VFRRFLQKLLEDIEAGRAEVPAYQLKQADTETAKTLDVLRERLERPGNQP
jgi:hypothetical protein